ncbi:MAG: RecX family transcriptional regulator [Paramuribaculum sp.]|nr:RecX family transcriptional regulator [Paramuribaculum sp.]
MKKKQLSSAQIVARLEDLCVRSEQSVFDLRQKISRWGLTDPMETDRIIDGLIDRRFVDDSRFARAYVRDKYRFDRWGRMKIIRGLIARRIPRPTIDEALEEIDNREYALNCYRLLCSRRRQIPDSVEPHDARQRLMRFAAARGYELSLIVRLIEKKRLWGNSTD